MLRRYAWGVLLYNLAVILWGAFVRATGSGAGCGSHWPTCNGEVIPRAETIETAIELTHRATSGVAFLLVVGLVVAAFRSRPKGHPARTAAALSMVLMVSEAAVGAGLVLLEYVAEDRSAARAWWVTAHLINTFMLVACMTITARKADPDATPFGSRRLGWWVVAAAAATLAVATTGAVTALGDTLFPAASLAEGVAADFSESAHFLVRLRVYHPLFALAAGGFVTAVAVGVGVRVRGGRMLALALVALFVLQIAGGLLNLVLLAPTWMQMIHLLLADLVWITLTLLGVEVFAAAQPGDQAAEAAALG